MSALLSLLLVGMALLAAAGALIGGWMTLRAFQEDRVIGRRMARATQPPDEPQELEVEEPTAEGRFARLVDGRAPWLRRSLASAGAPFTPVQVVVASLGMTASLLILFKLVGLSLLLAVPAAAWAGLAGPMGLISFLAARRRAQFLAQMPQTVDLMARSLQAGHPVTTAMSVAAHQMPAPIGPEFKKVLGEISLGLERDEALRNMLQRFPMAELQLFAASLEVTRETGGNVAEVLLKLSDTMRSKAQLRKKVEAISAEGKLSFWVISSLPVIVVSALMVLQPHYYAEVAGDPLFWPMMSVPPVLLAIGAFTIWRMISIKV
jgi:tight adherence protein B